MRYHGAAIMSAGEPRMGRTGIVLYHGLESGTELKEYGRIAEQAGLDSLWVTERYFHEETFSLLGFLGAVTERLRLGVAVVNPFTRHPALLGMAAATLDRITGGRFMLGLGRSDSWVIHDRMGMPYESPLATLEEAAVLLRALLSGERVTTQSGTFKLAEARLAIRPIQDPLPIYLAAIGPKALRLAGSLADGVLLNAYVPAAYVRWAVAEIRAAAEAAGRDPAAIEITCMLPIRLTADPASIWPALKERIVRLLAEAQVGEILLSKGGFDASILPELRALETAGNKAAASRLVTDEMVEAFYVAGTGKRCRGRIEEYRRAGVAVPLLLPLLTDFRRVAEELG